MSLAKVNLQQEWAAATAQLAFSLNKHQAYACWRREKLTQYPQDISNLIVPIEDLDNISAHEVDALKTCIRKTNFAIYQLPKNMTISKLQIHNFGQRLGLYQLDHNLCADAESISTIADSGADNYYIPYTNKALSWHTDGYYNRLDQRIRAFTIHCVTAAACGGQNELLDPEIAYIHLRDHDPSYVQALMHPEVMTIPANIINGLQVRPAQSGPVFSIDPYTQQLHMRYTARTRSIKWKQDSTTQNALKRLRAFLKTSPYCFKIALKAGQGIICNNVLHNRAQFTDDKNHHQVRRMYRARYYDRVRASAYH